jgi:uncharacterized protein YndB with AHSA1/START domain
MKLRLSIALRGLGMQSRNSLLHKEPLLMSLPIHQEVVLKANSKRVYEALTDASQFSKVTGGAPTEISREAGGLFSCFGGMITGRNLELVPNRLIVQAWRAANWPVGIYSTVKFELKEQGSNTARS